MTEQNEDEVFERSKQAALENERRSASTVEITLTGWATVAPEDLEQFEQQASSEARVYQARQRPTLARTFEGLAALAARESSDRAAGDGPAVWLRVSAELDETAGQEANKDDVGVIIARALYWYSVTTTRDGTKTLWGRVMAEMMANRARLQSLELSL
jgi:hypothetical protein